MVKQLYGRREYGNLVFNQLTVELTTASSYLGQGAGLKMLILVIFQVMITPHLTQIRGGGC